MCGIFCYFTTEKESIDLEQLKDNGSKCKHRGPDNTKELIIHGNNNLESSVGVLIHRDTKKVILT